MSGYVGVRLPSSLYWCAMDDLLLDIIAHLRRQSDRALASRELEAILMEHNRGIASNVRHFHKRQILPYYLHVKEQQPDR